MIARVIHNDARRFAEHLAMLSPTDRADAMMNAVLGSEGVYQHQPDTRRVIFEINHLGIRTSGLSEQDAIQSWIRKARATDPRGTEQKEHAA